MSRYQIYAMPMGGESLIDSQLGQFVASYTEANEIGLAIERCLDQFPIADGWEKHYVMNLDTRKETTADSLSENDGFDLEDF